MNKYQPFTATLVSTLGQAPHILPFGCWMPQMPGGALLAEYSTAFDAIENVAFAAENWDGEGALPVSYVTKQNAKVVLRDILPVVAVPEINPNSNGTLSFEWETNAGKAHLEIGNTKYSFYVSPKAGKTILYEGGVEDTLRFQGSLVASLLFPKTNATDTLTSIRYPSDVRNPA
jgi:hypothetical protein